MPAKASVISFDDLQSESEPVPEVGRKLASRCGDKTKIKSHALFCHVVETFAKHPSGNEHVLMLLG